MSNKVNAAFIAELQERIEFAEYMTDHAWKAWHAMLDDPETYDAFSTQRQHERWIRELWIKNTLEECLRIARGETEWWTNSEGVTFEVSVYEDELPC